MTETSFECVVGDSLADYLNGTYKPRTVWERVYLHLKSNSIDVYSPSQHAGKCVSPYVVLKNTGIIGDSGSNQIGSQTIDILLYSPATNYEDLEPYTTQVQGLLSKLKEYIRPTGNVTSITTDDIVKAYTQTMEYKTFQKLRR